MTEKATPGEVTVLASDLRVTYRVATDREDGRRFAFGFGVQNKSFEAIRGISLIAREGEFIGVIGRNGSGKSTLLRLLAGVESPTSGTVLVRSRPQLLGVGAALIPNLSGYENIRLGLLAMGLPPEEIPSRRQRIIALTDIGESIRRPMRTYSSGMKARLRFAISVAGDPDILIIDEALSTGDAAFLQRSKDAMRELMSRAGTGFLVNHSDSVIESMCNRVIWLDKGELIADGPAKTILGGYRSYVRNLAKGEEEYAAEILENQRQSLPRRLRSIREATPMPESTDDSA